jgi:hypothetical protein
VVRPPYAAALRLCLIGAERWAEISSAYHASATPLLRLKPHEYTNRIYAWCIERVAHDKIEEWEQDLHELLPWQDSTSEAAIQAESESFMKMMQQQR